ncbi:MAG: MarR family winged helix-turn-helix transcriptional regulator [Bacillota bacterium]
MNDNRIGQIAENIFLILPLIKKKLMRHEGFALGEDLSTTHFQILFLLLEYGEMSVTEMANSLEISKTNITQPIQKLIDKRYLKRIHSEDDRRYINIKLTAEGRDFLEEYKGCLANSLEEKLSGLQQSELDTLAQLLSSMKSIIAKI